jgi:hypothetical protein
MFLALYELICLKGEPVEDVLSPLLGCVGGLDGPRPQHVIDGLHDLCHLVLVDNSVPVHVIHPATGQIGLRTTENTNRVNPFGNWVK